LAKAFDEVAKQKGQNSQMAKKAILSKLFTNIIQKAPQDLSDVYGFCIQKLQPDYKKIELGIGDGLLLKSVSLATGRSLT